MKVSCPNCGAEIEFRYDDSFVRICDYCHAAVQRTDRGLETLGKVADLAPIESPLKLFAEGRLGNQSFMLVGMAQIRHAAGGIWQEWYAKLDGGRWGWLAEAQGRFYLTFQDEQWSGVDLRQLVPGAKIDLPVRGAPHAMTVAEATTGTYISARGELPFKLVPNETFHYADLADGRGTFATIDFGDGEDPPTLYVGQQVALADLHVKDGESIPLDTARPRQGQRLACPVCNAPIELRAADSLRVVCANCNALLDPTSGSLAVIAKLVQKPALDLPLGAKGHFDAFGEGELTVIGYVQRSARIAGEAYPFDEYLLYRADLGYRWLVKSDGHWSYVQPVANGAVELAGGGCNYDGVKFKLFQTAELNVDEVLGEFYWQVEVGERVSGTDYVAPPAMLSSETSETEETWSLATYMTWREVSAAFGGAGDVRDDAIGIAPNQPDAWTAASSVMAIAFVALIALGIVFGMLAKNASRLDQTFAFTPPSGSATASGAVTDSSLAVADLNAQVDADLKKADDDLRRLNDDPLGSGAGAGSAGSAGSAALASAGAGSNTIAEPGMTVFFSDSFELTAGQNVELQYESPGLLNNWVYAAVDLVNVATGQVISLDAELEYYAGYEDGESWSEGSREGHAVVGPQPPGAYMLRLEGQAGSGANEQLRIAVRQGVFRFAHLFLAILVLGLPFSIVGLVSWLHERRRWENSSNGKMPTTPLSVIVALMVAPFIVIAFLFRNMGKGNG